jgi:ACS family pantothenate transporter-like MFS transporter
MLPTLQILWAVIAFAQSTVTENWHLYLLRAITGFLEASSFGGTHLIRESVLYSKCLTYSGKLV